MTITKSLDEISDQVKKILKSQGVDVIMVLIRPDNDRGIECQPVVFAEPGDALLAVEHLRTFVRKKVCGLEAM